MVGQHVIGFGLQHPLQFVAGFLTAAFAFMDEREQQTLVDVSISQKEATLGTKLVSLGGDTAAPCASMVRDIHVLHTSSPVAEMLQ
jgi:hypothetical protein